jgi:hypothetical protein
MAVLVEGISVLVRIDAIASKMPGGWERFKMLIPNTTFCYDKELARVGFLDPSSVGDFIADLEDCGLKYFDEDVLEDIPVDMIVCDQQRGPVTECEWLEFGRIGVDGGKVGAAWLWEGPRMGYGLHMRAEMTIALPPGWEFKDSLSDKHEFVPNSLVSERRDH